MGCEVGSSQIMDSTADEDIIKPEFLIEEGEFPSGSQVVIYRKWVDSTQAQDLCNMLREHIPWREEAVRMYGRSIMQPRRVYACGNPGLVYQYSGLRLPVDSWLGADPPLSTIRHYRDAIHNLGFNFDSCLLNEYATGRQYIGYHSDKEALGPHNAVVTISLGGSRDFYFKPRTVKSKSQEQVPTTIKTRLHNGDMVVMLGDCQKRYTHSIPKRAQADYRISLTFRCISGTVSQ